MHGEQHCIYTYNKNRFLQYGTKVQQNVSVWHDFKRRIKITQNEIKKKQNPRTAHFHFVMRIKYLLRKWNLISHIPLSVSTAFKQCDYYIIYS